MRPDTVIPAAGIEIAAVIAGVVEHAVQHHAHTACGSLLAQCAEILLAAEQRVDALVVARVIAMVGIRLKHRIEINGGHMQAFQIVQLADDPAQRTAEKVVVENLAVLIRPVNRDIVPVFVQHTRRDPLPLRLNGHFVPAEAVGEDIICDAPAEPARRLIIGIVYSELEFIAQRVDDLRTSGIAARAVARAVRRIHGEIIPVQPRMRRREAGRIVVTRSGKAVPPHWKRLRLLAVLLHPEGDMLGAAFALGIGRKVNRLSGRYRAIRRFAPGITGIEHTIGNGIQKISPKHKISLYSIARTMRKVNKKPGMPAAASMMAWADRARAIAPAPSYYDNSRRCAVYPFHSNRGGPK